MTELSFSLLSQLFQVLYVLWKTGICCNFVVFYITTINHLVGNYYESNLLLFAALELLLSVVILFPNILFNFFFSLLFTRLYKGNKSCLCTVL